HPGVTLESVVGGMVERGAQTIFIAPDYQAGAEISQIDQQFPDTVIITNVALRADVVVMLPALASVGSVAAPMAQAAPPAAAEPESSSETGAGIPLMIILILTIFITVGGAALWRWPNIILGQRFGLPSQKTKGKSAKRRPSSAHTKALVIEQAVKDRATNFKATSEQQPILQKLCTYVYGDFHFDESFAIEPPSGEFLGECGIGIATPVNRTDATRIAALEIWMFDKNDIKTSTSVLASQYAMTNDELTKKLEPKGQVILADTDAVIEMQTKTLHLRARVLDIVYGFSDTFPTASFFDHIVIEIAVWKK
ncbi:MAG: hypothetical protein HY866_08765, partial [Chloroflexi bacterium]|nr:hypothetical protein [Chloroflexota bacterium]